MRASDPIHSRNPLDWIGKRYLNWVAYGLLLLLASLLQFTPHLLEIGNAKPLLLLPAIVSIALFTGPAGGMAAGAICGFVWDIYSGGLLGLYGLLLMLIGAGSGLSAWLFVRNNVLSGTLMSSAATLLFTLFAWGLTYLLLQKDQPFAVLWLYYLPDCLYTVLVSPLVYEAVKLTALFLRRRQ